MFRRVKRGRDVRAEAPWNYPYTRGEVERQRALNYALFAVPLTLLGVAYGYLPRGVEAFGWVAIWLVVFPLLLLGLVIVRDVLLRRTARLYEYVADEDNEEAEKVATERAEAASGQRQAMVEELRTLNAALVPRSRALRRSARPYF